MHRFEAALKRIASRLELPHPARSRVLLELSSDLDDLYASYRARGLGEEEAASRAERLLAPSADSLEALERVHGPVYRRLLARFSHRTRHRAERALLIGLTGAVLAGGAVGLARADAFADPSGFLGPVLAIGAVVAALAVVKLFHLYVKRDHEPGRLRTGLMPLLWLGGAAVVTGALGVLADLYGLAARVARTPEQETELVLAWLVRDAVMLAVALLVAVLAAFAWFVCLRRVVVIEHAEAVAYSARPGRPRTADPAGAISRATRNRT